MLPQLSDMQKSALVILYICYSHFIWEVLVCRHAPASLEINHVQSKLTVLQFNITAEISA